LPPASDIADEVVAKEPVEPDTAADDSVATRASCVDLVGSTVVEEIDAGETAAGVADAGEIAPSGSEIVTDDDIAPVVTTAELAETQAEPETQVEPETQAEHVEADVIAPDAVAADPVENDVAETPPVDIETTADDSAETIVEADEISAVAMTADDLSEEETDVVANDTPPCLDEIEADETPRISAEAIEAEAVEPNVASIETIEAPVLIVDDIATPEAAPVAPTVEDPEPVAVATEIAVPDGLDEREALIRRRWKETGIMMWRGVGQSTLCIQGSTALLPPKPGETMPQYDRLEFRLIDGLIVCEGFVVEPPAPLKNRSFARAA
jgi:hypothetical protein